MPVNNFGQVASHKSGGALFRSAQPDAEGLATISRLKVSKILQLNPEDGVYSCSTLCDNVVIEKIEIVPIDLGFDPPVSRIVQLVGEIYADVVSGKRVLVHCLKGRDRTGFFCGAFRLLKSGWKWDDMMKERDAYGAGLVYDLTVDAMFVSKLRELVS